MVQHSLAPGRLEPAIESTADDRELLGARLSARPRSGRWIAGGLVLALLAFAIQSAARNPRFE